MLLYPFGRVRALARQNEANIGLLALRAAVNEGWTLFDMVGGFANEFGTAEGVDALLSAGAIYSAAADTYEISAGGLIAGASGTPIGTYIHGGGLASAYDGNLAQNSVSGPARHTALLALHEIGKQWAGARIVAQARVTLNNSGVDRLLHNFGSGESVILELRGSNTNNASTATVLGTLTAVNVATANATFTVTASDTSTAYDYHWLTARHSSGGTTSSYFAEAEFWDYVAVPQLVSAAWPLGFEPISGRAVILIEPDAGAEPNTDLVCEMSRDDGATWSAADLSYQADFGAGIQVWVSGEADLGAQPAGSDFRLRLRSPTGTAGTVHAWYGQAR